MVGVGSFTSCDIYTCIYVPLIWTGMVPLTDTQFSLLPLP